MIYKEISGRLGNQMFQYAAVRSIYEKSSVKGKLVFNFQKGVLDRGFEDELKYFKVLKYDNNGKYKSNIFQKILLSIFNFSEKFVTLFCLILKKDMEFAKYKYEKKFSNFLSKFGIYFVRQGYVKFNNFNAKDKFLLGYFDSAKYFDDIRDILLEEFTPKKAPLTKNNNLYNYINSGESVCITIRRGDFVSNPVFKKNHYICTPNYFVNAMKIMKKKVKGARFVVFSDDVEWCRENIKFPGEVMFESGEDPVWEKLRLMYSCKHFIISNSTFSWWAQYLSRNDKKVVIAPSRWRNGGYSEDIYMNDWLIYDIDNNCLVGENNG